MNTIDQIKQRIPNHNFTEKEMEMLRLLQVYNDDYDFLLGFAVGLKTDVERDRLIRHIRAGGSTTETDLCLALLTIKRQRKR